MEYSKKFLEENATIRWPDLISQYGGVKISLKNMDTYTKIVLLEGRLKEIAWSLGENSKRYAEFEQEIKNLMK